MLDMNSEQALAQACQNKLQVIINYTKKTTGEFVTHTCGIQEIGVDKVGEPCVWGWDVNLNDHIRIFLIAYIQSIQVLNIPYIVTNGFPIKLNGVIVG